ncbi:MAG: diguanylate cyclase [Nitrosomonadales bacterium]|nr:diguanylate cyclase [Nitrosomonadales bacterium]
MDIAAGNRSIRLPKKGGGEVGELAEALNSMLDKLLSSDQIERENAFRKELIESLPGIFYMLDMHGRFLMWNRNLEQVLQCGPEELATKSALEFFKGEHKVNIENAIRQTIEMGSASVEAVLLAKDGTATPYHFTGRFVLRGETPVVIGLGRDISEQKRAEEELRVAAATFETHDPIIITNARSSIIRVNRAFTEITGYAAEEVLGKNPSMMSSGRHDKSFYAAMWKQLATTGSWAGEIWDRRKNGEIYPKWMTITAVKNGQGAVAQYVAIFSDITARKQEEEEIRSMAFYDVLTRLPNRRLFLERFQAALAASARYDDHGAILFIDLDNFKLLNDTLGHDYGDLLLVEVAKRIKSCVREIDTVSRLGGDEFVVLLENISSEREDSALKAGLVAEKIRESLARIYHLKACEHSNSPSIGISLYRGNAESMEVLLKYADSAMYQAKSAGRNNVRFYEPELQRYWEAMAGKLPGSAQ